MQHDFTRIHGPKISSIQHVPLPQFYLMELDNGIPVYYINDGSQELCKLDVVFTGGRHAEEKATQARATGSLVKEGSTKMKSSDMSSFFDYYGASYNCRSSLDFTTFTLFSLSKYFSELVGTFRDMVFDPVFPEGELVKFKKNSIERLAMDSAKNEVMSYRYLTEELFGADHVYGYNSTENSLNSLNRTDLISFHRHMVEHQVCTIFLTGRYSSDVLTELNKNFGQHSYKGDHKIAYQETPLRSLRKRSPAPNSLQSAIRLGRHFGSKRHEHYAELSFLNNVFGGFFGSRLMRNIREEKGYTYNIYSDIDSMMLDGYFYIASELDKVHVEPALKEIYKEMDMLCTDLVGEDELEMNRNYILGNLLNSVDGPFQAIRLIKSAILNNQDLDDIHQIIQKFTELTAEELRETARLYLKPSDYIEVIVG